MPELHELSRTEFETEIKQRLLALDNPWKVAALAARMTTLTLPGLTDGMAALPGLASEIKKERPFLWYWEDKHKKPQEYLLDTLRTWQCAWSAARFNDRKIASAADFRLAFSAYIDASFIIPSNTSSSITANAAYDAFIAAAIASDFDTAFNFVSRFAAKSTMRQKAVEYIIDLEKQSIKDFLRQPFDDLGKEKQALFLRELRKLKNDGFDYWADWYEARLRGDDLEEELTRESCLLSEDILAQNPAAINEYLKNLRDRKANRPLNRARAIFIGEGAAGKTSVIRVLHGETVIAGEGEMTPGVEIRRWAVPESEIQADLWDFGGQVMVHATHQFFLRSRCIYVLVVDARREYNANEQAEYWLHHVRAYGKDAPVLLVGNKADQDLSLNLDMNALTTKYPNVVKFYPLSCTEAGGKYKSHFERFQQDFIEQLKKIGTHQVLFTREQFCVLQELEQRSKKYSFLSKPVFANLCKENKLLQEQQENLLDLLDKLGVVIHFDQIQELNQFVLNPRWLTYGVYTLLYSPTAQDGKGYLLGTEVFKILSNKKPKDNIAKTLSYPPDKCGFLIKAMEQFEISYCPPDSPDRLMIPALLPPDTPTLHFDKTNALAFDFDFTGFLPKHVMPGFIVRQHLEIANNTVWRNGVQVRSKNYDAEALLQADSHERRLSLWVRGEHASRYFSVLHNDIMKMLGRMPELKFKEWVRLLGNNPEARAGFRQLLAMEAAGQRQYICEYGTFNLTEVLKIMPKEEREKQAAQNINNIGTVNGPVNLIQAEGDVHHVHIGDKIHNPSNFSLEQVRAEIQQLRAILADLKIADKPKAERALQDAEEELEKDQPDKEEVAGALDRVLKLVNKSGLLIGAVQEKLIPVAKKIGGWLGEYGQTLMNYFNT